MGGLFARIAYYLPYSSQRAMHNADCAITLAEDTASDQMMVHQETMAALDRATRELMRRIMDAPHFEGHLTVYDKSRLSSLMQKKSSCQSRLRFADTDHKQALASRDLLDKSRHILDVAKRNKGVSQALDFLQRRTPQLVQSISKSADLYTKIGEDHAEITVAMDELDGSMTAEPAPQEQEEPPEVDKVDAMFAQALYDFRSESQMRSLPTPQPAQQARKTLLPQHAVQREPTLGVSTIEIEMS